MTRSLAVKEIKTNLCLIHCLYFLDNKICFKFLLLKQSIAVCEISGRPIDNVYVKSS